MKYIWECYSVAGFGAEPTLFPTLKKAKEYIWNTLLPEAAEDLEKAYKRLIKYMPDGRGEAAVEFLKKLFASPKDLTQA